MSGVRIVSIPALESNQQNNARHRTDPGNIFLAIKFLYILFLRVFAAGTLTSFTLAFRPVECLRRIFHCPC